MKAFEFFNDFGDVEFPDDCKKIWEYLEYMGKINFSKRKLAWYYSTFSREYYCVGWVDPTNIGYIEDFAEWLSNKDI